MRMRLILNRLSRCRPKGMRLNASLALLTPGQRGEITRIGGSRSLRVRLMELGLLPGTAIKVERQAPLDGPIHVIVRGCHLSIRREDAARILVHLLPAVSATSLDKSCAA